jgi:predicted nucleotidyltransferase
VNRYGLSEKTMEAVHSVLARHPEIDQAILFGSRAKGTYKPGSDIDLVLKGPDLSGRILNRVCGELDDLPIPYEFSVILDQQMTDPEIRAHVDRAGICFYERKVAASG